jgi:hypothetical protein
MVARAPKLLEVSWIEQAEASVQEKFGALGLGLAICKSIVATHGVDRHNEALFVGQWAPTILILGLYNKLVKQHGSDQFHA